MTYTFTHHGASTALLGGLDMLASTAVDRANDYTISKASSRLRIGVGPTNAEWVAASHAFAVLRARPQLFSRALV